jgi:AbrB family looped-hinge helix DNA binding protein
MSKKIGSEACCASDEQTCGCRVESIVSIDERGQMVLPKELRDRVGIRGGEKFAVVSWEREGELCCISLIQVKNLSGMVNELLAPMLKEVTAK